MYRWWIWAQSSCFQVIWNPYLIHLVSTLNTSLSRKHFNFSNNLIHFYFYWSNIWPVVPVLFAKVNQELWQPLLVGKVPMCAVSLDHCVGSIYNVIKQVWRLQREESLKRSMGLPCLASAGVLVSFKSWEAAHYSRWPLSCTSEVIGPTHTNIHTPTRTQRSYQQCASAACLSRSHQQASLSAHISLWGVGLLLSCH